MFWGSRREERSTDIGSYFSLGFKEGRTYPDRSRAVGNPVGVSIGPSHEAIPRTIAEAGAAPVACLTYRAYQLEASLCSCFLPGLPGVSDESTRQNGALLLHPPKSDEA